MSQPTSSANLTDGVYNIYSTTVNSYLGFGSGWEGTDLTIGQLRSSDQSQQVITTHPLSAVLVTGLLTLLIVAGRTLSRHGDPVL
jgi:hypothetical protein